MVFTEATGADTWLGVAEIDLPFESCFVCRQVRECHHLDQDYLDLLSDRSSGYGGRSYFSAWVRPDQVQGGVDNSALIFSNRQRGLGLVLGIQIRIVDHLGGFYTGGVAPSGTLPGNGITSLPFSIRSRDERYFTPMDNPPLWTRSGWTETRI